MSGAARTATTYSAHQHKGMKIQPRSAYGHKSFNVLTDDVVEFAWIKAGLGLQAGGQFGVAHCACQGGSRQDFS